MAEAASTFDMTPVGPDVTAQRKVDIVLFLSQETDNGFKDKRLNELLTQLKLNRTTYMQWATRLPALEHAATLEETTPALPSKKSPAASSANGSADSGRKQGDVASGTSPEAPARRAVIIGDDFEQRTLAELGDGEKTIEGIPRSVFMEMRQYAGEGEFGLILAQGKATDVLRGDQPQKIAMLCAGWREYGYGLSKVANQFGLSEHFVERTLDDNKFFLSPEEQHAFELIDRLLSEPCGEFSGLHLRAAIAGIRLARKAKNRTLKPFKAKYGLTEINEKAFAAYITKKLAPWAFGEMSVMHGLSP